MLDQPKARFSAQGPAAGQGQPATPPTEATPQVSAPESTTPSTDTGLSEQRIRQIIQEETVNAFKGIQRQNQSQMAKLENHVKATVQNTLATMKAAGVSVSPEQEKAIENTVRQQIQPSEQPDEQTQTAAQPDKGSNEAAPDPVTAAGWKLMDAYGVAIEENDPEMTMLDMSSEAAYLKSVVSAIQTKQARIQTSPGARVAAGGGGPAGNPIASINDPNTLWQRAKAKR